MSDALLEARGVRVVRAGAVLLDDVTLGVAPGELVAVLGENGAGKSTLVGLLAGDVAPDAGTVLLDGQSLADWSTLEQARRRAVLPQQSSVAFAFTALEVVLMGRFAHDGGRPGAIDRAIALDALARTDASRFAQRRFPTLSGGERARVMLARAFAQVLRGEDDASRVPRALLLDEPIAALDVAHRHAALAAIRALVDDEGVAALVVLHDVNLAAAFADRVALLKAGRLLSVGPAAATLTEASLSACFSLPMRRVDVDGGSPPWFVPAVGVARRTSREPPFASPVRYDPEKEKR